MKLFVVPINQQWLDRMSPEQETLYSPECPYYEKNKLNLTKTSNNDDSCDNYCDCINEKDVRCK